MGHRATRFPENHYCEVLRGVRELNPSGIRRILAKRAQFLASDIERRVRLELPYTFQIDELRALVQVGVLLEERRLDELGEVAPAIAG